MVEDNQPSEGLNQSQLGEQQPTQETKKSRWLIWLLSGLVVLFVLIIFILRGLCTDAWYVRLLGLPANCSGTSTSTVPKLTLKDGILSIGASGDDAVPITLTGSKGEAGTPGPEGASGGRGSVGSKGTTGASGATGPAGPADPCSVLTTYFCQGGNSYSATALLGTNDTNNLQVVTAGDKTALFDVYGNTVLNRSEELGQIPLTIGANVNQNFIINSSSGFGGSTLSGNSDANFLNMSGSQVNNVTGSHGNYFSSSVSNSDSVYGSIYLSDVNALTSSFVNVASSTINGMTGAQAYLNQTTINNSFGLFGFTGWATLTNTIYTAGKFEGVNITNSNGIVGQFGYSTCDPSLGCGGPTFEVVDSYSIVGEALTTNINDSSALSVFTGATSLLAPSIISNVHSSVISGTDIEITNTNYSTIAGDANTVEGLDHSLLIGNNITLDATADATFDYSLIGADSAGNINTRINSKGNDSWFNLNAGNVGIGTNTPAGKLDVNGTTYLRTGTASVAGDWAVCRTPGTSEITVNTGATTCAVSSGRFKHNIEDLGIGLDFVDSLRPVSYNRNSDNVAEVGFIAEEIAALDSRLVFYEQDGTTVRGVKYEQMTAVLTKAVQEQGTKLEAINAQLISSGLKVESISEELKALAGRVDTVEDEVKALKARVDELEKVKAPAPSTVTPVPVAP